MTNFKRYAVSGLVVFALFGCKPPEGSPPDLAKTQRDALNKARAVEGQVQKQADEQDKKIEEESQ